MGQAPACSLLPTNICPLAPSPSPSPEPSSSRLLFLLLLQHLHLHRDSPHRHQSIDTVHCRTAPHRTATDKGSYLRECQQVHSSRGRQRVVDQKN